MSFMLFMVGYVSSRNLESPCKALCHLDDAAQELLRVAISELNFSVRAYDRILKVARTIANLAARAQLEAEDISEAIQ